MPLRADLYLVIPHVLSCRGTKQGATYWEWQLVELKSTPRSQQLCRTQGTSLHPMDESDVKGREKRGRLHLRPGWRVEGAGRQSGAGGQQVLQAPPALQPELVDGHGALRE